MMPQVVHFSCGGNPFQVEVARCGDLNCECTELFFHLQEVTEIGRPVPAGLNLRIRVDGDTWQEVAGPQGDPLVAQIAQELLDGYSATGKEHLQRLVRDKQRAVRRLRDYRFPPHLLEKGRLIAFREIISDSLDGPVEVSSFAYEWEHGDDYYLLDDLYCPNPACNCQEVHVPFLRCVRTSRMDRNRSTEEQFVAILSLDGKWRIAECSKCTEAEAKSLLRAWRQDEPDHLENFSWRYQKVKEIARRSFRRRGRLSEDHHLSLRPPLEPPNRLPFKLPEEEPDDETANQPASSGIRVGRNEPCPCGSGKKYKKCCGRGGTTRE